ncbi:hypothetical protein AK830_g5982 [Neonectria ditissima]|uniref:Uncharacterized protein n=1 Tax=Neonectria ditissima TaxID=78410 RepID=A0A0P7BJL8_9HYPO|nr:hypothetical protein AK830_g5982 [Neonectria ditissima]
MEVIQRRDGGLSGQDFSVLADEADRLVPVSLSLTTTDEERAKLMASIVSRSSAPRISIEANDFRSGPDPFSKQTFRKSLLKKLRNGWKNASTEARFLRLVELLQRDGCAIFAGLLDVASFRLLIDEFSDIMERSTSHAFLHSFAHLVEHPEFIRNPNFNDAMIHPLLIALLSYCLGGPARMTDARGKDTQPISVNAQDNMLHIDNTPFRDEYKILLCWEKGEVKGPSGQNFTFLPGTHKGNRPIRVDEHSQSWSTENDSVFITHDSMDGVFQFQKDVTGHGPTVVEVDYPQQPITVLFSAGSLVHHRYRNNNGTPRSCVITAFHLASDHPGTLLQGETGKKPESLVDILLGYQDGVDIETFCSLVAAKASAIESKISEVLDQDHQSTLVDASELVLSGENFDRWKGTTIDAPPTTQLKLQGGNCIHFPDSLIRRDILVRKIAAAMAYDKHGLLDLIIYEDGHEEIRKPARKSIWTMSREKMEQVLSKWLLALEAYQFTTADVQKPLYLQQKVNRVACCIRKNFPTIDFSVECNEREEQRVCSAHQLIVDLGESITRCEKVETYITTNLFLFFIIDQIIPYMNTDLKEVAAESCGIFLRTAFCPEGKRGIFSRTQDTTSTVDNIHGAGIESTFFIDVAV